MQVAVIGTGYVGLVAGVCFADAGNNVWCADIDQQKIKKLKDGIVPIYEPGLEELLKSTLRSQKIQFTSDVKQTVENSQVIFIAVGTPETASGEADMGPTMAVVKDIARYANANKFAVLKSTVPIGTAKKVQEIFNTNSSFKIEVISNPEFLKEGNAILDFLKPDRVVIGCKTEGAQNVMTELYSPFVKNGHPILFMDNTSAEMTKYAANSFLSVKISFINELAILADKVGADIEQVKAGFTSDSRINKAFFYPGLGFGGSCFPKDVKALIQTGQKNGVSMQLINAADEVNDRQKMWAFDKLKNHFGDLKGKKIAMWGLSFKPRTDDVREAPALYLIQALHKGGATVSAYDPAGGENALKSCKEDFKADFQLATDPWSALASADALVIATEWNEFRTPDFEKIKSLLKQPVIVDGRNVFNPSKMKSLGFQYYCVGRQALVEQVLLTNKKG